SGLALMADGIVAESASPPLRVARGFTAELEGWARAGRERLETLSSPMELEPGSTHISVEVDRRVNDALCSLYARTFAPGLMLLMDNDGSPGMLFRPRPGRAELCGEFIDGERLRGAAAYATGSVLTLERRLRGEGRGSLPPAVDVMVEPGRQRYGWYVGRRAFGGDLYAGGRKAVLRTRGGTITAQQQLETSWEIAREALRGVAATEDLQATDDLVTGRLPLPSEQRNWPQRRQDQREPARSTFAGLDRLSRGGIELEAVAASWDFVAFRLSEGPRQAVVCVPEGRLPVFTRLVRGGALDDLLRAYLDVSPQGRSLRSYRQVSQPAFYDDVSVSNTLLPGDRYGVGGGPIVRGRPGKVLLPPPEDGGGGGGIPWIPISWPPRRWIPIGIGTGLIVTIITGLIVFGGGGSGVSDEPTTVAQAPTPTLPAVAVAPSPTTQVEVPPTTVVEPPTATTVVEPPTPTTVAAPPTQAPPTQPPAPPGVQTIDITSTNTLLSYSPNCPPAFVAGNPPVGSVFNGTGTWTMTRTSTTTAYIATTGGFSGTLNIATRVMTMDRVDNAQVRRHKVVTWNANFTSATGFTDLITTIGGQDCVMRFQENVSAPSPWLF
ncbi:MAG TPA: hypothetical protein VIB47_02030, partial [Dehalococcoidia bacterium]